MQKLINKDNSKICNIYILLILFIYFTFSILFTYPLIFNINKGLWVGYGDIFASIWHNWVIKSKLSDHSGYTTLVAFPFGVNIKSPIKQPVLEIIFRSLTFLFNEITAYNIIVLCSFPFTAFSTFIFFRYLGFSIFSSFVGGFLFGFNPPAYLQSIGGHPTYYFNVFIPLMLILLFNNKIKRNFKSALIAGIGYCLVLFTSIYFGYFSIFIIILFILYDYKTSNVEIGYFIKNYFILLSTITILVILFEYQIFIEQFLKPNKELINIGRRRPFSELYVYSTRLYELFIPQITHPIFGDFFKDFVRIKHPSSNLFEQTLYLGITPLIILIATFYLFEKRYLSKRETTLFFFFLSGFIMMIIISLPPSVDILGLKIPLVSTLLYKIFPMFRVYSRAVIISIFFLSGVTTLFLDRIKKIIKRRSYILVGSILFTFIIFEYSEYSGDLILSTNETPHIYKWLAQDKKSKVIVEYPMMRTDEVSYYSYLYYQRIHKKKLVNGAEPGTKAWEFYLKIKDLEKPSTIKLLKEIGVDYIIIHFEKYKEGMISYPIKKFYSKNVASMTYNNGNPPAIPYGVKLYKDFGYDKIYILK